VVLAVSLRMVGINQPSIGYHNMKENELLSMAQEMRAQNSLSVKSIYFYDAFDPGFSARAYPRTPLVSYQVLGCWKLFGQNLWGPRLLNVCFGVGSVILIFILARILGFGYAPAAAAMTIVAVAPLSAYFSRNIQPESPALFFLCAALCAYAQSLRAMRISSLVYAALAISIAWAYEPRMAVAAWGVAAMFIWRARKLSWLVALPFVLMLAWSLKQQQSWVWMVGALPRDAGFFTLSYWHKYGKVIAWFSGGENFTIVYAFYAVCGCMLACMRTKNNAERFIIALAAAVVPYGTLYAHELYQTNYAQMPFVPLVALSAGYAMRFVADELQRRFRASFVAACVIALCCAAGWWGAYNSFVRMHSTVFMGVDAAGETIRELTQPHERFFLFSHAQGFGIARYAARYAGMPATLSDLQQKERAYDIRYACVFPGDYLQGLSARDPALAAYLQNNYHIKEVGLLEYPQRIAYLLLERGSTGVSVDKSLESLYGRIDPKQPYRILGRLNFLYAVRPSPAPDPAKQ
jgi:hypothetical protein